MRPLPAERFAQLLKDGRIRIDVLKQSDQTVSVRIRHLPSKVYVIASGVICEKKAIAYLTSEIRLRLGQDTNIKGSD